MIQAGGDHRPYHETGEGNAADAVPLYARAVLVVGDPVGPWVAALAARPQATVYVVTASSPENSPALARAAAVLSPADQPLPFPPKFFDALVLQWPSSETVGFDALLGTYHGMANHTGVIVAEVPAELGEDAERALQHLQWRLNHAWNSGTPANPRRVLRAFPGALDLRARARQLHEHGHPAWAYDLLYTAPAGITPEESAALSSDALYYLSEMPAPSPWPARLSRFARGHWLFSESIAAQPNDRRACEAMARLCEETAQTNLAHRLRAIARDESTRAVPDAPAPRADDARTPTIESPPRPPIASVLLLTRHQMDYGLDTLYDGLCETLGDAHVTEFPYKPSLHQAATGHANYYPATFGRKGENLAWEALLARLEAGAFDAILFGDCLHDIPREQVRRLLAASPATPLAVLDQGDSPEDDFEPLSRYLAPSQVVAYFKREKLQGAPYHPRVRPLPFSYPAARIPQAAHAPRENPVHWAGNRNVWIRRRYLAAMEQVLNTPFDRATSQAEYSEQLCRTQLAPSFFGGGFDTVRYWEVPAHGAMLLAERPPIEIPHNFRDGIEAVFFDDLHDFKEKLAHYAARPEACAAIARAGREHLLRCHTNTARAKQLLAALGEALTG